MLRPRRDFRESPLSDAARELKSATRIMILLSLAMAVGVLAAFKGWVLPELGPPLIGLFIACALTTVWFGARTHKKALEDREKESGRAMIVAIAVQLARQDDEALERIQARGGPAGEAAGMILQGRAEKRDRASRPEGGRQDRR